MVRKILTSATFMAAAATVAATDFSELEAALDSRWPDGQPGGAIIIARGDSVIYERYEGIADLGTGEEISPATRFNIASVSKQFTVMALLQQARLYGGGLPLLDTPMDSFVTYSRPWWHDITPAMLASHTSGLDDRRTGTREWKINATDDDAIAYFADLEAPAHAPGCYYDYLNPSFVLLARLVEQLSEGGGQLCALLEQLHALRKRRFAALQQTHDLFEPRDIFFKRFCHRHILPYCTHLPCS